MKKTLFAIAGIAVLAGVLFFAFSGSNNAKELTQIEKDRFIVSTEKVTARDIKEEIFFSGSVKGIEEAVLYPRTDGKLMSKVVKEGDFVKKNQVVAYIEKDEVGAVYEPVPVPSTIAGVIGRIEPSIGQHIDRNTAIAKVVNQSQVKIELYVPEKYVGKISKGQNATFTIEAFPGRVFNAKIAVVSPIIEVTSGSMYIELTADNKDGALKSGMFAKIRLVLGERTNVPSVTVNSVYTNEDDGSSYVFAPAGDVAVKKIVKTGERNNDYVEITSGLKAGDEVITHSFGLKDGSKVAVSKE
ncbi:RND family efflux transporter [Parelusimicrobium proximum]|uniref:efflux RND transporter periplasmic adaptor subunit n=1 Tax=Parelusimicrobium proximum TaxID=3228953 RepID=UPI003D16B5BE